MRDEQIEALDREWQRDQAKYPGMAKRTFVTNHLFGGQDISALASWVLTQADLHGQVYEGGAIHCNYMEPDPDRPGLTIVKTDTTKPYVHWKIQMEVVVDGKSQIDDRDDCESDW